VESIEGRYLAAPLLFIARGKTSRWTEDIQDR
jgi:hypothetical protein